MSFRLEHIGIAVADADTARRLFSALFGVETYKSEDVTSEAVRTHFLWAGSAKLELLEALSPDSPIARHLERRGAGLHHLAFEVSDVDAAAQRLSSAGFRVLGAGPKDGADGKRIFFLHPSDTGGVLIECCAAARPVWTDSAARDASLPRLVMVAEEVEALSGLAAALDPWFLVEAVAAAEFLAGGGTGASSGGQPGASASGRLGASASGQLGGSGGQPGASASGQPGASTAERLVWMGSLSAVPSGFSRIVLLDPSALLDAPGVLHIDTCARLAPSPSVVSLPEPLLAQSGERDRLLATLIRAHLI